MPSKTPGTAKGKAKPKEVAPVTDSKEGSGSEEATPESTPAKKKAVGKVANAAAGKKAAVVSASAKKATPRKKTGPSPFKRMSEEGEGPAPVNASFEGGTLQAKQFGKGDGYAHVVKFQASRPFALYKTVLLTEGPYAGFQAVLVKPAPPFNFAGLPEVVRKLIYECYFAPLGVLGSPITIDGHRTIEDKKDKFAKSYAAGDKNRVALLAVSKDINHVAGQIFYDHTFRFESTATSTEFFNQLHDVSRLRSVHIVNWTRVNAKCAMMALCNATNLRELKIDNNIGTVADTAKVAKDFYDASYKLLQAMGNKNDKAAAVDKLKFGKMAFTFTDKKDIKKPWDADMVEQFKSNLKAKLK